MGNRSGLAVYRTLHQDRTALLESFHGIDSGERGQTTIGPAECARNVTRGRCPHSVRTCSAALSATTARSLPAEEGSGLPLNPIAVSDDVDRCHGCWFQPECRVVDRPMVGTRPGALRNGTRIPPKPVVRYRTRPLLDKPSLYRKLTSRVHSCIQTVIR